MLFFRSGLFEVGPESAGAHPGPTCYKKGGPLTVTDANLILGRLLPEYFPKIFGPNENEPLDKAKTIEAFERLTSQVNGNFSKRQSFRIRDWNLLQISFIQINDFLMASHGHGAEPMTLEEVAMGFIKVANESMCRPIRALTQVKLFSIKFI